MMDILGFVFDIVLIGLLGAGISYATKLTKQLKEMRSSRAEMERFVLAFNSTVNRAEAGIKGLKDAARSSGDDLEVLIEKSNGLRDELMFLVESADQIATRLSQTASTATRAAPTGPAKAKPKAKTAPAAQKKPLVEVSSIVPKEKTFASSSAAEKELLRVLKKMG